MGTCPRFPNRQPLPSTTLTTKRGQPDQGKIILKPRNLSCRGNRDPGGLLCLFYRYGNCVQIRLSPLPHGITGMYKLVSQQTVHATILYEW